MKTRPGAPHHNIRKGFREHHVRAAVAALRRDEVIILPTETLYALAASGTSATGVQKIFAIKQRNLAQRLPLIFADTEQVRESCRLEGRSLEYAQAFWPGPLTLVLPAREHVPAHLPAADGTLAVRVPDHAFCRRVAAKLGAPLTATSANLSGAAPARALQEVPVTLRDQVALLFDGGTCERGIPSTILRIDHEGICILRPGAVSLRELNLTRGA